LEATGSGGGGGGQDALVAGVSCGGGYRGKVARRDCEKALQASGQHRDFIVRESETEPGSHSITVKVRTLHATLDVRG